MNNAQLIKLANTAVLCVTAHTLSPAAALNVYKFKKAVRALYMNYVQDERAVAAECGIKDMKGLKARYNELTSKPDKTENEQNELESLTASANEYIKLRVALLNQEVQLEGFRLLSFDEWFKLQNENQYVNINGSCHDVLSGEVEELLEGVLWQAPED